MSTIKNKYIGITHGIEDDMINNRIYVNAWKFSNCSQGIHLFDEVHSLEDHYLHCDICGMEVHIEKIVIPDGNDISI